MKKTLLVLILSISFNLFCQVDTSDVFVVGDINSTQKVIKEIDARNTFKFDMAKAYMEQSIFSVEHLLSNKTSSIEPEIIALWGPNDWVFNYYTETFKPEDSVLRDAYPGIQIGAGFGYKRYINKYKRGLYGHYLGLKIKNKTGKFFPFLYSNSFPNAFGYVSITELSLYYGYSFWLFNLIQIDPFLGASVASTFVTYKKGFNSNEYSNQVIFKPSIVFCLRIGVSSSIGNFFLQ